MKDLNTPESAKNTHDYMIPVSIAKELSNKDLKPIIKELHDISQELHTLNMILRKKL